MNPLSIVCKHYQLGTLLELPQPIVGSKQHQLWRINTTQGCYVVKQFSPVIFDRQLDAALIEATEQLAAAVAQRTGNAIAAIVCNDRYVLNWVQQCVVVYPWIDRQPLSYEMITAMHCWQIGHALARIHQLNVSMTNFSVVQPPPLCSIEKLTLLWQQATELTSLVQAEDKVWLKEVYQQTNEALVLADPAKFVLSHTDINPHNVLWLIPQQPLMIDWECASYVHPTIELLGVALNWSGVTTGYLKEENFKAVIKGYAEFMGETPVLTKGLLCASYRSWLAWLEYMLQRLLQQTQPLQSIFYLEFQQTLTALRVLTQQAETILTMLS